MLRKYLILDDGIDVVIDDEAHDNGSVVMGFLRRNGIGNDKALLHVCRVGEEKNSASKSSNEVLHDWDITDGFSEAELGDLMEFLVNNIAMLCRTALDEETMTTLDIVE